MPELLELIEDVMAQADETNHVTACIPEANEPHGCDSCGAATPDVDLWAENQETGEQLWLCLPCGR